jgi:hypothetical protein
MSFDVNFDVNTVVKTLIENGYNTPEKLEELGALLYEAAERYQEDQIAQQRAAVELPPGQNLSSVDLKMYSIPNFKTRLGLLYNLVDSGNAKNLTDQDYADLQTDHWTRRNLQNAIANDSPMYLGLE